MKTEGENIQPKTWRTKKKAKGGKVGSRDHVRDKQATLWHFVTEPRSIIGGERETDRGT